jgi:hypothetical protein
MVCHLDVIDMVVFMVVLGLTGDSRFARMSRVWVGFNVWAICRWDRMNGHKAHEKGV